MLVGLRHQFLGLGKLLRLRGHVRSIGFVEGTARIPHGQGYDTWSAWAMSNRATRNTVCAQAGRGTSSGAVQHRAGFCGSPAWATT